MLDPTFEIALMLGLFVLGGVLGMLSRLGPLSGWLAVVLPLTGPPLGLWLTATFC